MKSLLIALALLSLAAVARSGTPTITGPCPDFKPVENLNDAKISGVWFALGHGMVGAEVDKTKPEKIMKCLKETIASTPTGYDSTITFVDENNKTQTKKVKGTKLEGTQAKYSMSGEMLDSKKNITLTVSIIDTDYNNIMLGTGCFSDGTKHGYKVVAFGREKSYPAGEMDKIKEFFKTRGITTELKPVDQSC